MCMQTVRRTPSYTRAGLTSTAKDTHRCQEDRRQVPRWKASTFRPSGGSGGSSPAKEKGELP